MTDNEVEIAKAKARQAVAETTGKAIDLIASAAPFLGRVLGTPVESAVGIVSDRLQYYRLEKFLDLMETAEASLKRRGITDLRSIPAKIALPLLEAATVEEDDDLHAIWARLLANALDPSKPAPKKMYVDLVSLLEPIDAKIFQFLGNQKWKLFKASWYPQSAIKDDVWPQGFAVSRLSKELEISEDMIKVSLLNLARCQLVLDELNAYLPDPDTSGPRVDHPKAIFRPTRLGWELFEACQPDAE